MKPNSLRGVAAVFAGVAIASVAFGSAGASNSTTKKAITQGKARLIKTSALPGHWTTSPYDSSGGSGGGGGGGGLGGGGLTGACNTTIPGVEANPPTVESPYFDEKNTSIELQEEIDVFPNAKQAAKDLAFTRSSTAQQCFSQYFNQNKASFAKAAGNGATIGTITAQFVPIHSYDDGTVDMRLVIPINIGGGTANLYLDFVLMVKGQYEAIIDETDVGTPLPGSLAAKVDQLVAQKLSRR